MADSIDGQSTLGRACGGWKVLAIVVAAACLYAPVMNGLLHDWWQDDGASYGFAVPPIALALAWSRRGRLRSAPRAASGYGLYLLLLSLLMLVVGDRAADAFLMQLSFVVFLGGLTLTFWGWRRFRVLAFPLMVLSTMVPLPSLILSRVAVPLQLLASGVASELVRLAGGTVYRDGNVLQLPGLTLGVAEACSGLHSISAIVVIALLMGFSHCTRVFSRAALLALAIPLAIVVNVLRVSGTVLLAGANEGLAMGFYHAFSGWLVFVASAGLMYYLARGLHAWLET